MFNRRGGKKSRSPLTVPVTGTRPLRPDLELVGRTGPNIPRDLVLRCGARQNAFIIPDAQQDPVHRLLPLDGQQYLDGQRPLAGIPLNLPPGRGKYKRKSRKGKKGNKGNKRRIGRRTTKRISNSRLGKKRTRKH